MFNSASLLEDHTSAVHEAGNRGGRIELTRVFGDGSSDPRRRPGGGGGAGGKGGHGGDETSSSGGAAVPEEFQTGPLPADLFDGPSLHAAAGVQEPKNGPGDGGGGSWVTPSFGGVKTASRNTAGEAFPALPSSGPTSAGADASWGSSSNGRPKPARQPGARPATTVPQAGDFPTLGGKKTNRPAILGRSRHQVVSRPAAQARPAPKSKHTGAPKVAPVDDPELAYYMHPSSTAEPAPPAPKPVVHNQAPMQALSSAVAFPSLGGGGPVGAAPEWGNGSSSATQQGKKSSQLFDSKLRGGTIDFVEPVDCRDRNGRLIAEIRQICSDEQFMSFKQSSGQMRRGDMSPADFFEDCVDVLGSKLDSTFPELVALLPNVTIQQELYVLGG